MCYILFFCRNGDPRGKKYGANRANVVFVPSHNESAEMTERDGTVLLSPSIEHAQPSSLYLRLQILRTKLAFILGASNVIIT